MAYQFKIQITGIENPPVWRRILVPDITFDAFHRVIQTIFGWKTYHLYHFSLQPWITEPVYKIPDDFDDDIIEDSRIFKLSEAFTTPEQAFAYVYDFGDNWVHHITLEKMADEKVITAICTDGKGACPPEDCGGVSGYQNLIKILSDPGNPEYRATKKWMGLAKGEQWDVNSFDIETVNNKLKSVQLL